MLDRRAVAAAIQLDDAGRIDEAAEAFRALLIESPDDVAALCRLGALELKRLNPSEAAPLLDRAVALRPDVSEIQLHRGIAYQALSHWGTAAQAFERTIELSPGNAAAHFHLGEVALTLGHRDAAITLLRQTMLLDPAAPEPCVLLGHILQAHQCWADAEHCFRQALRLLLAKGKMREDGSVLDLQCQLGNVLLKQDQLAAARQVFDEMLSVAPHLAEIHGNLAFILEREGAVDRAVAAGRKAVSINPGLAPAWNNLGVALRSRHELDEAFEAFQRAAALVPGDPLATFNAASVLLQRGDYQAGWAGYESRRQLLAQPPRTYPAPRWTGGLLAGTLLLHAEQGFGDTLQFARFISLAKERSGARILVEAPAPLADLLRTVVGIDDVLPSGAPVPPIAAEAPLPSLMGLLDLALPDVAVRVPYLHVDATRQTFWHKSLHAESANSARRAGAISVGLIWQGNPGQSQDVVRSCPPHWFLRLAGVPNVRWFSLQKELSTLPEELEFGLDVTPLGHRLHDFTETAAAMSALDLIISVDTSTAHLAGALGRPVWTLLCHTPDWRWGLSDSRTPWYPTMRLFRQPRWGDWGSVMDQARNELTELACRRRELARAG